MTQGGQTSAPGGQQVPGTPSTSAPAPTAPTPTPTTPVPTTPAPTAPAPAAPAPTRPTPTPTAPSPAAPAAPPTIPTPTTPGGPAVAPGGQAMTPEGQTMTPEERNRITSNDFADLLIDYSGDPSVFNRFQNATVHIINDTLAVIHVPVSQITENTIKELGYAVMPSIYGTISEASLEASGILRLRNIPNFSLRGQGVLVGIVDSGINYTNPIFQNADKTTRIVSIWDQTVSTGNFPGHTFYGTEFTRDQINEALQNANPLSVVPTTDEQGHGTMLAGVAAGNEVPDSGFYGVAPDSELVVVKLKPAKPYLKDFFRIPQSAVGYQENDILFGVEYLLDTARRLNRPIAICLALGTSMGSHDGRSYLSTLLSGYAGNPGVGLLVAGGNEGNARRHYFGTIDRTSGSDTIELSVGENESGFSMELWGDTPSTLTMDILTPSGEYVPRLNATLDETITLTFIFEPTIINVDFQIVEAQSGSQLILLRFQKPAPGIWRFKVYASDSLTTSYHVWLPMEDFISQNTFFVRSNIYTTILSAGNAVVPITVTAYNIEDDSLYLNSSRGYTRTNTIKPEIAAPGVNILVPSVNNTFTTVSGTSPAAAHATGIAAMLLEWAIVRGNYRNMNTLDMKVFMIRGARRDAKLRYPNRDWGYGILDVYNIFDILRSEVTAGPT